MSGIICLSWCVILHVLNYILRVCFNDQLTCTNEAAVSIRWMGIRTENHHIFRMDTVMSTNSKVGAGEKARFIPRALKFIQPDLTRARPKTAEEVILDKTHFDEQFNYLCTSPLTATKLITTMKCIHYSLLSVAYQPIPWTWITGELVEVLMVLQ